MTRPDNRAASVELIRAIVTDTEPTREGGSAPEDGTPGSAAPADERYIERFLAHYGLAGLAAARQKRDRRIGAPLLLSPELEAALEPYRVRTALETGLRMEAAERCRAVLADDGVRSLLFKGGALVRDGVYADPGARLLEDVDVLVRPSDAEAAVLALGRAGFRAWTPWESTRRQWLSAFTLDTPDAIAGIPCTIDLHWSTRYGALRLATAEDEDPLWDGADIASGVPSPEGHFVLLAEHFLKHLRVLAHLRGLADLARLAPRVTSAEALLHHARARGAEARVRLVVRALGDLHGVRIPSAVTEAFGADAGAAAAERRYLSPHRLYGAFPLRTSRAGGLLMRWRLEGGVRNGWREIMQVLAPPAPWLQARYPHMPGGSAGRRLRYAVALAAWTVGAGRSPLSPNQD